MLPGHMMKNRLMQSGGQWPLMEGETHATTTSTWDKQRFTPQFSVGVQNLPEVRT